MEWLRQLAGPVAVCNLRLEHLYGPGDDERKFVPWIIRQCLENVPEIKLTRGDQSRDFIYIDDAVAAFLCVLESSGKGQPFSEFQLGSGTAISMRKFVESVHAATGSTSGLNFGAIPHRYGETMFSKADISSLQSLGWEPAIDLETGLQSIISKVRKVPEPIF